MAEAEGRVTKGRPRTTKTLAWRDADEAVLRRLRAQVAARFGVVVTERDRPPSATGLELVRRGDADPETVLTVTFEAEAA